MSDQDQKRQMRFDINFDGPKIDLTKDKPEATLNFSDEVTTEHGTFRIRLTIKGEHDPVGKLSDSLQLLRDTPLTLTAKCLQTRITDFEP